MTARLHGDVTASTVFMATAEVREKWQIVIPAESKHRNGLQRNLPELIMSARRPSKPNLVQIHPLGFWANRWNITFLHFFMLYLLISETATGQTDWWTCANLKDVKSWYNVPFLGYLNLILNPYLSPKTLKILPKTLPTRPCLSQTDHVSAAHTIHWGYQL